MPQTTNNPQYFDKNFNNPTKEIMASSGIWNDTPYASNPYAIDIPNSLIPNTGINTTTTSSTTTSSTPPPSSGTMPDLGVLSDGYMYPDDMLIFNDYIHYVGNPIRFNPQVFLQEAVASFNNTTAATGV